MRPAVESTYTIADLERWSFAGTAFAVLGHPIAHSLSPSMHNAALTELALTDPRFSDWRYFKFDIAPADLARALTLFHANGFAGLNLTVPHKVLVLDHLRTTDATARAVGAANTLCRTAGGWEGFNTDGFGLVNALREALDAQLQGAAVVILGAGGAARAAAVECLRLGCRSLCLGNRSSEGLKALLAELSKVPSGAEVQGFELAALPTNMPPDVIVINATSLGLQPADSAPIDLRYLPRTARVFDMIYNPPATALLRQAAQLGLRHANGLSMLVHQGARALEFWTGVAAPVKIMRHATRAHLSA